MAYTTIDNPELYFQTKLFTGTGSALSVTLDGSEDMQPDLVWIKERSASDSAHNLTDSVRGAGKGLFSNTTADEYDYGTGSDGTVRSFDSDGFTLGTATQVNPSSVTMVAWCWKANGSGSANTDGDLSSTVSVNATSKFSMVKYTSADTGSAKTVGHGLGVAPTMIIFKQLKVVNWICYIEEIGNTNTMWFDTNHGSSAVNYFNDTSPTTSLFTVNGSLEDAYSTIAYCFADVQGFSKFGSYTGNGNADGPFIYTGFKPAYVMVKNTDEAENWIIFDNKRPGYNLTDALLKPNLSNAESASGVKFDLLSNGFKARVSDAEGNSDGDEFIYMAFAEAPFVNSNGVPCNAR